MKMKAKKESKKAVKPKEEGKPKVEPKYNRTIASGRTLRGTRK